MVIYSRICAYCGMIQPMRMLFIVIILGILICNVSCTTYHRTHQTFFFDNGTKAAEGDFTSYDDWLCKRNLELGTSCKPWQARLRYGPWTYWYPNGHKRAEITYSIIVHYDCCSNSPCNHPYEHVVGHVYLYDENGKLIHRIDANKYEVLVDFHCQGKSQYVAFDFELPSDIAPHQPDAFNPYYTFDRIK